MKKSKRAKSSKSEDQGSVPITGISSGDVSVHKAVVHRDGYPDVYGVIVMLASNGVYEDRHIFLDPVQALEIGAALIQEAKAAAVKSSISSPRGDLN